MQSLPHFKNRLLVLIISVLLISSCSIKKNNNLAVFRALNQSLVISNANITASNVILYNSLKERLSDPVTRDKAFIWEPKVEIIEELSTNMINYIESLKNHLRKKASITINFTDSLKEDDVDAVDVLFDTNSKGKELEEKLKKYKKDMLAIDSGMGAEFSHYNVFKPIDSVIMQEGFTKTYFNHVPAIEAFAMLNKFQNESKVMENEMLTYCHNNMSNDVIFDGPQPRPIAVQSSSYVKGGDEIEITAGVAEFYPAAHPAVTINGKNASVNDDGVAIYHLKASAKPGEHKVQVVINFFKPDGTRNTMIEDMIYTVIKDSI